MRMCGLNETRWDETSLLFFDVCFSGRMLAMAVYACD